MAKDNTYTLEELKITPEERVRLIKELAERHKNINYMLTEEKMENAFDQLYSLDERIDAEQNIRVTYDICFVIGDIIEILGGYRRNGKY